MLESDVQVDTALQVAIAAVENSASAGRRGSAAKALTHVCDLLQSLATSSQVTPEQSACLHSLLTLFARPVHTGHPLGRQEAAPQGAGHEGQESKKALAHALFNVRDSNLICQEYGNVYAMIEGEARRRKINRARRRGGILEVRTVARDE